MILLLKITEEDAQDKNRTIETEITEEMLIVPALVAHNTTEQAIMPKSMVPDLGWFDHSYLSPTQRWYCKDISIE